MKTEDLIKQIKEYMEDSKISIQSIAKELSYSRSTISRFLSGNYVGNTTEIEDKLHKFLEDNRKIEEVKITEKTKKIYEVPLLLNNNDAIETMGVCRNCQMYSEMGIIVGKTGFGKTHVLRQYAKFSKVAMVECDDTMSVRDLLDDIESALGIPPMSGTNHKKLLRIREFFSVNKGYLLIIDEADKLINKHTQKKMEVLRSIIDDERADVGIVISGEPNLENMLIAYLDRFANRNENYYKLSGLSEREVKDYLKEFNFGDDAMNEMVRRGINKKNGSFRVLNRTMKNILKNLGSLDEVITMDTVMKATKMTLVK